jgi:hypothetical protein
MAPRKNHIESFEQMPYILGVNDRGFVEFAYNGWYKNLTRDRIKPEDVAWISNLLAQLTDKQMQDAFRAAYYDPDVAARFITRLREKIQQGRALTLAATRN